MDEKQFFTPHNVMWTFGGCLGIYLTAYGIISVVMPALEFVFGSLFDSRDFFRGFLRVIPAAVKIAVGFILFNRAKKELIH